MSEIGFYDNAPWRSKRLEILKKLNWECQICKQHGRHRRAVIVHHVFHRDEFPQWELDELVRDPETGEQCRNLLPVCRECHETECHPERMRAKVEKSEPITPERW